MSEIISQSLDFHCANIVAEISHDGTMVIFILTTLTPQVQGGGQSVTFTVLCGYF